MVAGGLVALAVLAVSIASLTIGKLGIPLDRLPRALAGHASGAEGFVLGRLRGPRLLVALGAGAALAVSGGLFQTVTRNPLASPDILGLTSGAGAGAAIASVYFSGMIPVGAVFGAAAAAGLIFVATGRGFSSPAHLIIAGIGVAAMAVAVIRYVVMAGMRRQSTALVAYIAGSLNARSWTDVLIVAVGLAALLPAAAGLGQRLRIIELGDELADALGAGARRTRTGAILVAVALSTAAVCVAGPVTFVSLTAPQIARRLAGSPGANIAVSALTGALLLVLADLVVQQVPVFDDLPVGVVTAGLGGIYLGYLLVREWKKGSM